jgi:tetratricopeptide (TPR) repeat protein
MPKNQGQNAADLTHEGYNLYKEDKLDEAIDKYKQALKVDPYFFLARSNMGRALQEQGKLLEAITEWEELLKQGPPPSIAIPIPRLIDDAKRLLYEQENIGKDKNLPNADILVKSYIEELEKPKANWRDINTKVIRIGETAIPDLIVALKSKNELLQVRVVHLLNFIGGEKAKNALIEAYKGGSEKLRHGIKSYIKDIDEQIKKMPINKPQKKWWKFWNIKPTAILKTNENVIIKKETNRSSIVNMPLNKNIDTKNRIMKIVDPISLSLANYEDITNIGDEAIPVIIEILKNPKTKFGYVQTPPLVMALRYFSEKGNNDAINALIQISEKKILLLDSFSGPALNLANAYVSDIHKNSPPQPTPSNLNNNYQVSTHSTRNPSNQKLESFLNNTPLSIGSLDEFKKGQADFSNWGSGLITGSMNFIIDKIGNKLSEIKAAPTSLDIQKTSSNYDWQISNLKDFTVRIQASIPGMLAGFYIGRIGENLYGLFGCNINHNENEIKSTSEPPPNETPILKGLCACDSCGKDLNKGQGVLNNRNSQLYCEDCWIRIKSNDPKGEELFLGEIWIAGVERTNRLWV